MEQVSGYLEKLSFWDKLDDKEKELAGSNAFIRKYEKGSLIYSDSDSCLGYVYVIKGMVRVFITSEEGREITLFKIEEGDSCVLSASCVIKQLSIDSQMSASSDTELLVIPSGTVDKLSESNIYFKNYVLELSTERLSTVTWVMEQIIFTRFDRRMAGYLLDFYERTGQQSIRMTQEQIAVEVNSAREVVARMLKRFASEGLIDFKRGVITIKDKDGLEKLLG